MQSCADFCVLTLSPVFFYYILMFVIAFALFYEFSRYTISKVYFFLIVMHLISNPIILKIKVPWRSQRGKNLKSRSLPKQSQNYNLISGLFFHYAVLLDFICIDPLFNICYISRPLILSTFKKSFLIIRKPIKNTIFQK